MGRRNRPLSRFILNWEGRGNRKERLRNRGQFFPEPRPSDRQLNQVESAWLLDFFSKL